MRVNAVRENANQCQNSKHTKLYHSYVALTTDPC